MLKYIYQNNVSLKAPAHFKQLEIKVGEIQQPRHNRRL